MILVVSGFLVAIFVDYRKVLDEVDTSYSVSHNEATVSMKRVQQTATKNGIKEWSLDAGSVQFMNEKNQAFFKDLAVTFYLQDGLPVYLTADEGVLKTDSNDIEAFGNVVVQKNDYRLNTEKIQYEHHRRVIFAVKPVKITARAFDLEANSMTFYLKTKKTELKGNVRGVFRELISM
jgi:lipopolysaccharide export system protein LptC